jgi:hypothetical protein
LNARAPGRHTDGVRWLKRLLGDDIPPVPVLLRIADPCGTPVSALRVDVEWFPSGARGMLRPWTAEGGFCVIPWLADETRARLTLRTEKGERTVEIERDRDDAGRVYDLRLSTPLADHRASDR